MIATTLAQVSGLANPRFLRNAFFPIIGLAAALATLYASLHGGLAAALEAFSRQSGTVQGLEIAGAAVAAFVAASVLDSQVIVIIRVFEGYAAPVRWLAPIGRWRHA